VRGRERKSKRRRKRVRRGKLEEPRGDRDPRSYIEVFARIIVY